METATTKKIDGRNSLYKNCDKALNGTITDITKVEMKHTRYGIQYIYMIDIDVLGTDGNVYDIRLQYWSKLEKLNFYAGQKIDFMITYKPSLSRNSSDYHFDTIEQHFEQNIINR